MIPGQEAALRDLLEIVAGLISVPPPAHHADDDLYLNTLRAHADVAAGGLRGLLNGCVLDNIAVQSAGHSLYLAAGALPATGYEVTP